MTELFNMISETPGAIPLLIVIRGSHAYGTNLETSDVDYSGIFIQSIDDILGFGYKDQINDDKNDIVFYEIRRFLELLKANNPNILELLNTPKDCIVYKHAIFDTVLQHKDKFITKVCAKSFAQYAIQQIKKAKGQDKKQNWEKSKVIKKDILDFCYVIDGDKSIPWKEWNSSRGFEEKFIGSINIPNARDIYALYYDKDSYLCFSDSIPESMREDYKKNRRDRDEPMGFGYKGLIKLGEGSEPESNQLRLSSIPKGENSIATITYNKDGYTMYCKDYSSYQEWLKNKNEARWVDVKGHGQKIDGKNMMHCRRLLDVAKEIGEGKGINVRRHNAEYLISIRKGEVDLQTLIDESDGIIGEINTIFENSNLPESVSEELINNLLLTIRKNIYNI